MTWYDTRLLVIARGIPSKLKNLRSQVLEDSSEIDRSTSTNTLCVVALLQQTVNTPDWELHYKITLGYIGSSAMITSVEEYEIGRASCRERV